MNRFIVFIAPKEKPEAIQIKTVGMYYRFISLSPEIG
jgi:hypothetical protein